jgi:hypothetical protein
MRITLASDAVAAIKIRSAYNCMLRENYTNAKRRLQELHSIFNTCLENTMDPVEYNKVYDLVARALLEMTFNRKQNAHMLMREAHYMIIDKYFYCGADEPEVDLD